MRQKIYLPLCLVFLLSIVSAKGNTIYVNVNVPGGTNNGTSWQNAFTDLKDALATAQLGDEVWVAQGTYFPTGGTNRYISFELPNGVALYGGFQGFENAVSQRDWQSNETILSGDIGIPNDSTDNAFTIVFIENADSTTLVDGFSFVWGAATSGIAVEPVLGRTKTGGGMFITATGQGQMSVPKVMNCQFRHNAALRRGGAIYIKNASSGFANPLLFNCVFLENTSLGWGGAISQAGGVAEDGIQLLQDCTFLNNTAIQGGAFYFTETNGPGKLLLLNCDFNSNFAPLGGAFFFEDFGMDGILEFKQCNFTGNHSTSEGGAFSNYTRAGSSRIVFKSCFFIGNSSELGGSGGVGGAGSFGNLGAENAVLEILHCQFIDNFASNSGGSLSILSYDFLIANCVFSNSQAFIKRGGAIKYDWKSGHPPRKQKIFNSLFFNNLAGLNGGAIRYTAGTNDSIEILNSIFLGNTAAGEWDNLFLEGDGDLDVLVDLKIGNSSFDVEECDSIANIADSCEGGMLFNQYPQFRDTAAGDFSLLPCSPAINAGDNSFLNVLGITTDLAGNPRIQDGTVDMGPFEAPSMTIANVEVQPVDCAGTNGGSVNFAIQNGCEPFNFEWQTDGSSGTGIDELAAGIYQFTITDANDRNTATEVVIPAEGNLSLAITVTPIHCHDSKDGTAAITPLSGTPPYEFLWQDGGTDSLITGIGGGLFSVTVTDRNACTDVLEFELLAPDSLFLQASAMPVSCFGETDGSASVVVIGGKPPYSYFWSNAQIDSTAVNLAPGVYFVTITDANGCLASASANVSEPAQLLLDTLSQDLRCYGENGGMAALFPSGGKPPYFYAWSGGETDSVLTNLPSGNYSATVTDSHQCTQSAQFEITEPDSLSLTASTTNISAAGAMDGAIEVQQISGGTPPYSLQWNTGDTTLLIENLAPGNYTLTVTDGNDCEQVYNFIVDVETAVQEASQLGFEVFLFPNPAQNGAQVWLSFRAVKKQNLEVQLLGIDGKTLTKQRLSLPPGDSIHALKFPIGAGLFLVQLENEGGERRYLKVVAW